MKPRRNQPSPCLSCDRMVNPRLCDDKDCKAWRSWFIQRWEALRALPRQHLEQAGGTPLGTKIGGQRYVLPHQVMGYLEKDPCVGCLCPKDLCAEPCRVRRDWDMARNEVFL